MRVAIAGGSGYIGGELVRLVLGHPELELAQVTSESRAGRYLHQVHPNLRGQTDLRFVVDLDARLLIVAVSSQSRMIRRNMGRTSDDRAGVTHKLNAVSAVTNDSRTIQAEHGVQVYENAAAPIILDCSSVYRSRASEIHVQTIVPVARNGHVE